MRMRYGVNLELEEQANELIRKSLEGVTSHEAKRDVLTPWKEKDRRSREVYASSGVVDPAIRRGQFSRVANKTSLHLNSVEGKVRSRGRVPAADPWSGHGEGITLSLRQFVEGGD